MVIVIVILSITCAILIGACLYLVADVKNKSKLIENGSEIVKSYSKKFQTLEKLNNSIKELENFLSSLEVRCDDKVAELDRIKQMCDDERNNIAKLSDLFDSKVDELNKLYDEKFNEFESKCCTYQTCITELTNEKEAVKMDLDSMQLEKKKLTDEVDELRELLDEMCKWHNDAVRSNLVSKNGILNITESAKRVISLVEEIKSSYSELSEDLDGLVWKRVWLPAMQQLVADSGVNGKTGIYKLSLVEDDSVCYVGQAVDIKERWYQHAKKMCGVMAKGKEKLYDGGWKPSDFKWEVIEWCDAKDFDKWCDAKDLDERERYWIEYWGAKMGLNKK